MKGRLSKLRDVIKAEGFETYIDEEETLHLLRQENYEELGGYSLS
jgi:hypothetical protein